MPSALQDELLSNYSTSELEQREGVVTVARVIGSAVVVCASGALLSTWVFRRRASFLFSHIPFLVLVCLSCEFIGISTILMGECFVDSAIPLLAPPPPVTQPPRNGILSQDQHALEESREDQIAASNSAAIITAESVRFALFFLGFTLALSTQFSRLWQALKVFSNTGLMKPKVTIWQFFGVSGAVGLVPTALVIFRIAFFIPDQSCGFIISYSATLGAALMAAFIYIYLLLLALAVLGMTVKLSRKGALVGDAQSLALTSCFCLIMEPAVDLSVRFGGFNVDSAILLASIAHSIAIIIYIRQVFVPKLERIVLSPTELMAHIRLENDMKDLERQTWNRSDLPWPLSLPLISHCLCCRPPKIMQEQDAQATPIIRMIPLPSGSMRGRFFSPQEIRESYMFEAAEDDGLVDDMLVLRRPHGLAAGAREVDGEARSTANGLVEPMHSWENGQSASTYQTRSGKLADLGSASSGNLRRGTSSTPAEASSESPKFAKDSGEC